MRISIFLLVILSNRERQTQSTVDQVRLPPKFYQLEWDTWKRVHRLKYEPYDEPSRYNSWMLNFHRVGVHNLRFAEGKEMYLQGMTRFADHTPRQLMKNSLRFVPADIFYKDVTPVKFRVQEVSEEMTWPLIGWTTTEKLPRFYLNGWAFSTLETIHAQMYNVTGLRRKLSIREIFECVQRSTNRPFVSLDAFSYIQRNGITLDSRYTAGRYPGSVECNRHGQHPRIEIGGYHILEPEDETNLKIGLALIGPISVSIKVTTNFYFYTSGVFYDPACRYEHQIRINHAVLLVGYGKDPLKGDVWIIQNTWGNQWGEDGFARMSRNTLINCGIASAAIYPVL